VFGILLEVQLQVDADKPFTWPMYAVSARARYRCLREPHLAVLSAMAHGRDDVPTSVAVASAAARGAAALPEPLRMLCFRLIRSSLGKAARKSLEMHPENERLLLELKRLQDAEAEGEAILRMMETPRFRCLLWVRANRQVSR
jgi:hypothetical protein